MASVNLVILVGHLGKDPETRYMPDGAAVTVISLATTETWKDKNGEKQERTEWNRVKFFRKRAEIAGEYLKKGMQIYIEGHLATQKWTDKNGIDRYTTEIISDKMKMLGKKTDGAAAGTSGASSETSEPKQNQSPNTGTGTGFDDMEDDIPF